jgi:hypothetical protein
LACLTTSASAAVLYHEDFNDGTIDGTTTELQLGTMAAGIASFDDTDGGVKANINVVQNLSAPVMTISFETAAPVTGADNELLLRASVGTGRDMSSSGDAVVDLIFHRDLGNRGGFLNNGNESLFAVINNQAAELTFTSPVDGSTVTLLGFQYVSYVRDDATGVFGAGAKGIEDFEGGVRAITRFAIGNASNANLGTFALDSVAVVDQVSFETVAVPEPSALALLGAGGLLAMRRRRSA